MKTVIAALLLALCPPASASPYFHAGLNAVKPGIFQPVMSGFGLATGVIVPVIMHDAADGHLLIPGVTWDLLDVGYSKGDYGPSLHFGPSVNLDEPIKAGAREICTAVFPGWTGDNRYRFLKALFAPDGKDTPAALAVGLMPRLDVPAINPRLWRGGLDLAATLSHKF